MNVTKHFSGKEIVSLFTQYSDEESDTIDEDDDTKRRISHSERAKALEVAFIVYKTASECNWDGRYVYKVFV